MAKVHSFSLSKYGEQVTYSREPASVLSLLKNGRYTVTISPEKRPRSLDQNALMWLWFTCISSETGTPIQDVHDYYCSKFLRRLITWNGTTRTIVEGTSKLTKERMTTFMNYVKADALSEFGIRLPLPEDKYYDEFCQMYK